MRILKKIFLLLAVITLLAGYNHRGSELYAAAMRSELGAITSARPPAAVLTEADEEMQAVRIRQAAEKVSPAVVTVYSIRESDPEESTPGAFWRAFRPKMMQISTGSGFFVDADGYLLTNYHVVNDTEAELQVELENGDVYPARLVFEDEAKDLAILKVEGSTFPVLSLGDSSGLQRGQLVLSYGNAYGQHPQSLAIGEVWRMHQTIWAEGEESAELEDVIQMTSQLYPGYSGGPTFDENGYVVGVNVATAMGRSRMSFAIPINDAKEIIELAVRDTVAAR